MQVQRFNRKLLGGRPINWCKKMMLQIGNTVPRLGVLLRRAHISCS